MELKPETSPTPLSIARLVAPLTLHDNVDAAPCVIDEGLAENDRMTGACVAGVLFCQVRCAVDQPECS